MTTLLGGLEPSTFLQRHWQKKPLLVRQAIPGFNGILDRAGLLSLSTREDAISRLVIENPGRRRGRWELHEGPFDGDASGLPESHWTLLVQGVEGLAPGGWELLRRFDFLPAARVDDLMISYAVEHGSVGPHEDLYDVFLLQGPGRRRWQISEKGDHALVDGAPIKMLRNFVAEEEYVLGPGDMLYLPPGVAHWGVALEPCFTYSIGFVAPSHEALLQNFLAFLGQRVERTIDPEVMYGDPDLERPADPLAIGDRMIETVDSLLGTLRWDRALVEEFLGGLLTGPKPNVVFDLPEKPLSREAFAKRLRGGGRLRLALPSRGLVRGDRVFVNGAMYAVDAATLRLFRELLANRSVALPVSPTESGLTILHGMAAVGFVVV